jgi:archaemetzincin
MKPSPLYILLVGPLPETHLLGPLSRYLESVFGVPARLHSESIDPDDAFDPSRRQYHSSEILLQILRAAPPDAHRLLGVTALDLFVPILTFLFGEAQYDGPAALVSIHRLRPEFYDEPPDPMLLRERTLKEAVHELGHTFGLIHCPVPGCVMNASTGVEGIDAKSLRFCPRCREAVDARR